MMDLSKGAIRGLNGILLFAELAMDVRLVLLRLKLTAAIFFSYAVICFKN